MQKGVQEGVQKGEQALLLRLLRSKFRQVPDWAEEKIRQATPEQIIVWSENILAANSIAEVFGQ